MQYLLWVIRFVAATECSFALLSLMSLLSWTAFSNIFYFTQSTQVDMVTCSCDLGVPSLTLVSSLSLEAAVASSSCFTFINSIFASSSASRQISFAELVWDHSVTQQPNQIAT